MDSEYSGNAKQFYTPLSKSYKPLPTEKQRDEAMRGWKNETNTRLKESGSGEMVTNSLFHGFLIVFFVLSVIIVLVLGTFFVVYVKDGKFKDVNTQTVNVEPSINVTSNTENQFDNTFNNDVQLNASIIMNVANLNIYTNNTG